MESEENQQGTEEEKVPGLVGLHQKEAEVAADSAPSNDGEPSKPNENEPANPDQ